MSKRNRIIILLISVILVLILAVWGYFKFEHGHSKKTGTDKAAGPLQTEEKLDLSKLKKDKSLPDCCNVK